MPVLFGYTWLTPLCFQLNTANAANFPVKHRQLRYFSGSTQLKPLFFRLNAANAAILPVKRR